MFRSVWHPLPAALQPTSVALPAATAYDSAATRSAGGSYTAPLAVDGDPGVGDAELCARVVNNAGVSWLTVRNCRQHKHDPLVAC